MDKTLLFAIAFGLFAAGTVFLAVSDIQANHAGSAYFCGMMTGVFGLISTILFFAVLTK